MSIFSKLLTTTFAKILNSNFSKFLNFLLMKLKLSFLAFVFFHFATSQITLYSPITLSKPDCLAFDNANNIYILDSYYSKIIKLNAALIQSNVTPDFGFSSATQISFNPIDNCIYVSISIFGGGRIDKITTSGVVTALTDPNNSNPVLGVVCDAAGNIFYSSNNGKIYKRTLNGVITEIAANVYGLNLALDNIGNLIVCSNFNESIYRINVTTSVKTTIVSTANIFIRRIAVNKLTNDIYFTKSDGTLVYKIANGATNYTTYLSGLVTGDNGLAVNNNYLYVTDYDNRKIYRSSNVLKNETFEKTNTTIFPNPANNFISIKSDGIDIEKVDILDINGKLITTISKDFEKINVENLTKGTYILKVNNGNNSAKFIKQ